MRWSPSNDTVAGFVDSPAVSVVIVGGAVVEDVRLSRGRSWTRRETPERSSGRTDRSLAGHSKTPDSPRTPCSQAPGSPESLAGPPRDSCTASQRLGPRGQESSASLRDGKVLTGPSEATGRGVTLACLSGGCDLRRSRFDALREGTALPKIETAAPPLIAIPVQLRALDLWPRRCAVCRRRRRQYKGRDPWTGDRKERALCAPCARALWVRNCEERTRCGKYLAIDEPAPWCPLCHRRPRENKGTRRGRRRYFRFCAPCYRRDREERGLPAYRGVKGVRLWLRERLRRVGRRPRHRTGRPSQPRPEWLTESVFDLPDPAIARLPAWTPPTDSEETLSDGSLCSVWTSSSHQWTSRLVVPTNLEVP